MRICIGSLKVGVFFPHLMTKLCREAGVPITSIEQSLKPSKSIISDILFQQYIELRAKQIKNWNKQQQEAITTPTPSQRLTRAQQDVSESSHPKLDWMIQWMQESRPILQEIARQNNIRVPSYTPDMFKPTNVEQEEEVHESETEGEDEENDGSEEMDEEDY
ncbi:hypothetical protein Goarm_021525 [Gossypium armourianum]|uniref:Uncharacterized protein n=1 Tax=Gossypium armourianum TaxID=34283 RepID=A0A7J9ISY4_9ROSI|nr:hypothetical protein [Gossypium armourianum]